MNTQSAKQQAKTVFTLGKDTVNAWLDDRAMSLAASLAFYTILSLAPLLVVAVSLAGLFFGAEAARGEITQQLQGLLGKEGGDAIQAILAHAQKPATGVVGTLVGLVVLFFGASGVFGELQESMNTIWEVKTKPGRGLKGIVKDRFFSFAMVLGVAFLLLVSLLLSAGLHALGTVLTTGLPGGEVLWTIVNFAVSFGVVALLFALIFKFIPDVKIGWRDVGYGAAFTAFLFTVGKFLIGLYLGKASVGSPYGAAGSLVVLVVWLYYSAQILFLGAEFTQVYAAHFGSRILPSENAVAVKREETALPEGHPTPSTAHAPAAPTDSRASRPPPPPREAHAR